MSFCSPQCIHSGKIFTLDDICTDCGRRGWSPGDGILYPFPKFQSSGITYANDDRRDLLDIFREPKRTRLDVIAKCWGVKSTNPEKNLQQLSKIAANWGLELLALRDGVTLPQRPKLSNVVKDEPLILKLQGHTHTSVPMPQCADGEPKAIQNPEPLAKKMSDDLNLLKAVLAGRDNLRGSVNSTGLKTMQRQSIDGVLNATGSFSIAALPTGFGKTRIAQAATWALRRMGKGPTLMISPLISLMDDQRAQFSQFSEDIESNRNLRIGPSSGLSTAFLTVAESRSKLELMDRSIKDELDLLCCSPETLMSWSAGQMWIDTLTRSKNPPSLLVIDEAHVIGDWGASIRPEFQLLSWIKQRLLMANPELRVLLMSATISQDEEKELKKLFTTGFTRINNTVRVTKTREDLYFHVERYDKDDPHSFDPIIEQIHHAWSTVPARWNSKMDPTRYSPPAIIYTPYKKIAEGEVKNKAKQHFDLVKTYTGDTSPDSRETIRDQFVRNEFDCLVATSAFGMGIDKPDVWITSFLGMPWTLKGLYQSFGRAARKSNWESSDHTDWRSGVCLCALPDKGGYPIFKPELGPLKTLERLHDLFYSPNTVVTDNGYVLLPIYENLERPYWNPCQNPSTNHQSTTGSGDEENEEDSKDDYNFTSGFIDWDDVVQKEKYRAEKSRSALIGQRMWVIACLQRTKKVDFLGIHRKVLFRSPDGPTLLEEIIRTKGYDGVMTALMNIPGSSHIDDKSRAFAVLKINSRIDDWSDASKIAIEGYSILRNRHKQGSDELREFIRKVESGDCIRKLFSRVIGIDSANSEECLNLNRAMPCSNCKGKMGNKLANLEILWSDENTTRILNWHNNQATQQNWDPADIGELAELSSMIKVEEIVTMNELIDVHDKYVDFHNLVHPVELDSTKTAGDYEIRHYPDNQKTIANLEVRILSSGKTQIQVVGSKMSLSGWSGILLNPKRGLAIVY